MKRTWLITGISTGFGRRMAEVLLERGERVAGTVRNASSVATLAERHADQLQVRVLDLANFNDIRPVVNDLFDSFGRIDVVVSNAGYGLFGAAEEMTDNQVLHQISVNLVGSIQLVRAALPHLRRQGGGRILQFSSVGGQAAFPGGSLYHATKWGVEGFIDALAQEVAVFNIGCTLIEPGGARTNFRYQSAKLSPKLAAYDASPARMTHKIVEEARVLPIGDPNKMVDIIIDSVDSNPAMRRIALGSDAYHVMHKQLTDRLAALETQRELALTTDISRES